MDNTIESKNTELLINLVQETGKINGKLDMLSTRQQEQTTWMNSIEYRIRAVEIKTSKNTLLTGGIVIVIWGIFMKHFDII